GGHGFATLLQGVTTQGYDYTHCLILLMFEMVYRVSLVFVWHRISGIGVWPHIARCQILVFACQKKRPGINPAGSLGGSLFIDRPVLQP
ncbi:hypothetical protein, partial [Craterilacuibacter sinensis]|uniref:hypothetical protein n=1 Tax=Craterilacuibacter sinensis TaxID=2686017 RepID=UPI001C81355D